MLMHIIYAHAVYYSIVTILFSEIVNSHRYCLLVGITFFPRCTFFDRVHNILLLYILIQLLRQPVNVFNTRVLVICQIIFFKFFLSSPTNP